MLSCSTQLAMQSDAFTVATHMINVTCKYLLTSQTTCALKKCYPRPRFAVSFDTENPDLPDREKGLDIWKQILQGVPSTFKALGEGEQAGFSQRANPSR